MTREVVLKAHPKGEPQESDFELHEAPDAAPGDGEVLVRNVFVSVDPYMRGRMTGVRTYVAPYELGGSIDGVDQDNMANTLRMGGGMECVRGAAPMWG